MDIEFPYFQVIREDNSYTPLRYFELQQSILSTNDANAYRNHVRAHRYRDTEKSARPRIVFIDMKSCNHLFLFTGLPFRQEVIFGYYRSQNDLSCLSTHVFFLGTMKLVLFQDGITLSLLVPCLTCDPITFSKIRTLTLRGIRKSWDAQNIGLHQYIVFLDKPVQGKCDLLQDELAMLTNFNFCTAATIAERYNLTLLRAKSREVADVMRNNDNSFGHSILVDFDYIPRYLFTYFEPYFRSVNFLTITNPPSARSGIVTFVLPFELEIWWHLLVSVISVAGILTFSAWAGGGRDDGIPMKTEGLWREAGFYAAAMAEKVITVTFIFLGQVGDSSGRTYRKGKVAIIVFTIWFFGNLFLMVNYYQGSIYSCIAVLYPPRTPGGVEELVDFDIPIVDTGTYTTFNGTKETNLHDVVLPKLIPSVSQNPKLYQLLTRFKAKLLSINDMYVREMLHKIVNENSARTYPLLVLFMFRDDFAYFVRANNYLGNRYIVHNRGESPFQVVHYKSGQTNLFTPYLARGLRRMQEFGLTHRWTNLNPILAMLTFKKRLLVRGKYFEVVQKVLGNAKERVIFHESNPVPLDVIRPAFYICGIIISLGIAGFALENLKILVQWEKNLVNAVRRIYNTTRAWVIQNFHSVKRAGNRARKTPGFGLGKPIAICFTWRVRIVGKVGDWGAN